MGHQLVALRRSLGTFFQCVKSISNQGTTGCVVGALYSDEKQHIRRRERFPSTRGLGVVGVVFNLMAWLPRMWHSSRRAKLWVLIFLSLEDQRNRRDSQLPGGHTLHMKAHTWNASAPSKLTLRFFQSRILLYRAQRAAKALVSMSILSQRTSFPWFECVYLVHQSLAILVWVEKAAAQQSQDLDQLRQSFARWTRPRAQRSLRKHLQELSRRHQDDRTASGPAASCTSVETRVSSWRSPTRSSAS